MKQLATDGGFSFTSMMLIAANSFWLLFILTGLGVPLPMSDSVLYFVEYSSLFLGPAAAALAIAGALEWSRQGKPVRAAVLSFLAGSAIVCSSVFWIFRLHGMR